MPKGATSERTERLEARITRSQKKLFRRAADLQGRSLSDLVVQTVTEAATDVVRTHELIVLTPEESKKFVEVLMNPPGPNERLRAAWRKHSKDFRE